jgi:pyruvate dehydrogenase E2 component (dihydrolipoamide acetyltransferase)
MAYEFKFPDVGEGIHEGTLVKWLKKEGENVKADENIAEVETDKAVVEIPSPKKGTLLKLYHKEGETITVGEVLAVIGEKGEKVPDKPIGEKKKHYTGSIVGFVPDKAEEIENKTAKATVQAHESIAAVPAARKLAKDKGIDLSTIKGTGNKGIITVKDIESSSKKPKVTKKYDMFGYVDRIPLKGIRKITAVKMKQAVDKGALLTHHDHIDVTELNEVRKKNNVKSGKKSAHLTFLPYIIKATVEALKKHPYVASSLEGNEVIIKKYYNVGVAVDTPEGLMVPVIKGADQKDLHKLAEEIANFVEKAKTRKIDLMDLKGGVFTITNIGVIGSTYFTPIPNYPESCILGTGRIEDRPRVIDGKVTSRKVMPISFSYDHQVIDGAEAARFMNDLRIMLENPETLSK